MPLRWAQHSWEMLHDREAQKSFRGKGIPWMMENEKRQGRKWRRGRKREGETLEPYVKHPSPCYSLAWHAESGVPLKTYRTRICNSMSPRWLICSLKCETCCLKDPHTSRQHAYCSLLETRRWALLISPIYLCVLKRKTRGRNVRVHLRSAFLFFFKHLAGGIDFSLPLLL